MYTWMQVFPLTLYSQISIFSQMANIEVLTLRLVCLTLCRLLHWIINISESWLWCSSSSLSVVSTASRLSLLWPAVCLSVSSTWGRTWFPHSLSSLICVHWLVSGCSGWLRTPVVELTPAHIASLCSAACLACRSLTTKVSMQCFCYTHNWHKWPQRTDDIGDDCNQASVWYVCLQ